MQAPPIPIDEIKRLRAIQSLAILDSAAEERFDRITRLARRVFDVPIALVSLIDHDRQWFKSKQGLEACETGRDISFCGHAIVHEAALIVPNAAMDVRFHDNPLVTGAPYIRFYAGHPVHAPDGSRIGTLCLIDRKPREFSESEVLSLADLAAMVDRELSLLALATADDLTHLCNRRGFCNIADRVIELGRRTARNATLIVIDLDGFKAINDVFGHSEGDTVLRQFGALLLTHFRASDVVARMGGDEFCVFASGATEVSLAASLERLDASFAASELAVRHPQLSWSHGVAETECTPSTSVHELLDLADRRMYEAKRCSRADRRVSTR